MLHPILLKRLAKLRLAVGDPILVNSGYRCKSYNEQVDGVPHSYHLLGMAVDIAISNYDLVQLATHADIIGFTGIGIYDTFLHLDIRPYKERWDNRT